MVEAFLSVPEVAILKDVAQSAVVRAIQDGRLAAWTKGRMHFMRTEDVMDWKPVRGRGRKTIGHDDLRANHQEEE